MPEMAKYRQELIFDNRKRIQLMSYLIFPLGVVLVLQHLLWPGFIRTTEHFSAYLIIYLVLAAAGILALIYPLILRNREVNIGVERLIQEGILVLFVSIGAALTVLDLSNSRGFTAYVSVVVFSGLLLRNRSLPVLLVFGLSGIAIALAANLQGVLFDLGMYIQIGIYSLMGIVLSIARENDRKERYLSQLQLLEQSIIDPLTDVYNRRFFIEELERSVQRRIRYHHGFCLAIIDIDGFKNINDKFGHLVGDSVLESYAWKLMDHLRESDVVSRYGGDEFMVLLAETGMDEALAVLDRLRIYFEATPFDGINRTVTCSIGVVECSEEGSTAELIQAADELLYRAKDEGRNRICH